MCILDYGMQRGVCWLTMYEIEVFEVVSGVWRYLGVTFASCVVVLRVSNVNCFACEVTY